MAQWKYVDWPKKLYIMLWKGLIPVNFIVSAQTLSKYICHVYVNAYNLTTKIYAHSIYLQLCYDSKQSIYASLLQLNGEARSK